MSNLSQAINLVRRSDLSLQEIDDFTIFLRKVDEKNLSALVKIFRDTPSVISQCYQNIKNKKKAITSKNQGAWRDILETEQQVLLRMAIANIK